MSTEKRALLSPTWYLAALTLAVVGWIVGVVVAGGAWDAVRGASVTSANQPLSAQGTSVAVFTDVLQPGRQVSCRSREPGLRSQRIPAAPLPFSIEDDGTTWHLVAFEPEGRNNMTLSCQPKDHRADNAQYAFATVDGFVRRAQIGNSIIKASLLGAFVGAAVIFVRRRRQLRAR